jgi:hypothetical protein
MILSSRGVVEIIHVYRAPNFVILESYQLVKTKIYYLSCALDRLDVLGSVDIDIAP